MSHTTFRTVTGQAPATVGQFRAAVLRGFRVHNPDAHVVFRTKVQRYGPLRHQPQGTVSFVAEILAGDNDGNVEALTAMSYRYGGVVNGHTGTGHVEVTRGSLA